MHIIWRLSETKLNLHSNYTNDQVTPQPLHHLKAPSTNQHHHHSIIEYIRGSPESIRSYDVYHLLFSEHHFLYEVTCYNSGYSRHQYVGHYRARYLYKRTHQGGK